jgi:serine/threonine protein kinase
MVANIIISLEYIHSRKIIHRDIKPENIVFDEQGYLYITDFGISRVMRVGNNMDTSGTPGYMSPEVMCRQDHSYVSDYYAVGIIMYEFAYGKVSALLIPETLQGKRQKRNQRSDFGGATGAAQRRGVDCGHEFVYQPRELSHSKEP